MAENQNIKVPYGKLKNSSLHKPQRYDEIINDVDSKNAIVVFAAILANYEDKMIKLIEVDELVHGPTPHWRLCVYGLNEMPSREKIRAIIEDMQPVKPLSIVFEKERQSHTLFCGEFLTHALCVLMPTMAPVSSLSRMPDLIEMISSEKVEKSPSIWRSSPSAEEQKHEKIKSSLLRRSSASSSSSVALKPKTDRITKARRRFESRSLLSKWADYVAGVKWEDIAKAVEASTDGGQYSSDEYDPD
jgi:hypothetical protein